MGHAVKGLFGGGAKAPTVPPIPVAPPAATPPTLANSQVSASGNNARARAAAAAGAQSKGGSAGTGAGSEALSTPPTAQATLLGGSS